jgi:hypothetical protein
MEATKMRKPRLPKGDAIIEIELPTTCVCGEGVFVALSSKGLVGIDAPCSRAVRTAARLGDGSLTECEKLKALLLAQARGGSRFERDPALVEAVRATLASHVRRSTRVQRERRLRAPARLKVGITRQAVRGVQRAGANVSVVKLMAYGGETRAPDYTRILGRPEPVEVAEVRLRGEPVMPEWVERVIAQVEAAPALSLRRLRYLIELERGGE